MSENIDTTKEVELNEKIGVVGNELSDALESQSGADEFQLPSMISTMSAHFKDSKRLTERVVLTWDNINYSTLVKDVSKSKFMKKVYKEKQILINQSGAAETGQLLAIMGPTGCGKTSLLNILAGRCPGNSQNVVRLSGDVFINGIKRDDAKFRGISAYVLQDDYLYPHLTVSETFALAASFYLPASNTAAMRSEFVDAIIAELGLNKARDTIIGDEKIRGVSGGERRRASIGVQLICDPAVLFLDEPTSGLDSFQALSVMESMKNMSSNGRLIISVIHQPRSSIFNMFDRLLLLTDGRSSFFGDSMNAVKYFNQLGYSCPESFNPSDFFLDILSPDNRSPEAEAMTQARIKHIYESWVGAEIEIKKERRQLYSQESLQSNTTSIDNMQVIGGESRTVLRELHKLLLLGWRAWTEQSRDMVTIGIKMTFTIFFAGIIGGIYSNIGNSQASIQNRFGVLFFVVINQLFASVNAVFATFPKEKNVVNRERASNAYTTIAYFAAKVITEIPINVLPSIIYSCILYWIIGLNPNTFGLFILILMYTNFVGVVLGLAISAGAPNPETASALGLPILIISILFGGFYIRVDSLPIVLNWFPYISIIRWAFEALCINEFTGLTFSCGSLPVSQCISTGTQALTILGFENTAVSFPIFGISMCLIGFLLIGYTILLRSKPVYTDVGHEGQMFKKFMTQMETLPESVSADETKKQSQVKQIGPVIEHTKKATEPAPAASVESYSQVPTEEAIN